MRTLGRLLGVMVLLSTCFRALPAAAAIVFEDDFSGAALNPFWETRADIPGSSVVQQGGVLTVDSPTAPSSYWDSGIASVGRFGQTDFIASVDFRLPAGGAMAWLSITQDIPVEGHVYGIYLYDFHHYSSWLRNDVFTGARAEQYKFEDERTEWHNLKISYDADLQFATIFIDHVAVAADPVDLSNSFIFVHMKDRNFYGPGPSSAQFDNFRLEEFADSAAGVPEPSSLLTSFLLAALVPLRRLWSPPGGRNGGRLVYKRP